MSNFTKEEIINSIKSCLNGECDGCSFNDPCVPSEECMTGLLDYALFIIKTQNENSEKVAEEIKKLTHALRNHMTSVTRYVRLKKPETMTEEAFSERQARYQAYADDAVSSILSLLNDNDTLTKIEKGEVPEEKKRKCNCKRKIADEIKEEVLEALKSNYRVREERIKRLDEKGSSIIGDDFLRYCDGKIDALRGISDFIDELIEKM